MAVHLEVAADRNARPRRPPEMMEPSRQVLPQLLGSHQGRPPLQQVAAVALGHSDRLPAVAVAAAVAAVQRLKRHRQCTCPVAVAAVEMVAAAAEAAAAVAAAGGEAVHHMPGSKLRMHILAESKPEGMEAYFILRINTEGEIFVYWILKQMDNGRRKLESRILRSSSSSSSRKTRVVGYPQQ